LEFNRSKKLCPRYEGSLNSSHQSFEVATSARCRKKSRDVRGRLPTAILRDTTTSWAAFCAPHSIREGTNQRYEIHPDLRGTSDHAPLTVTLPGPDSEVPVTRWSIQSGTDEEQAYLGEVLESLELLLGWEGQMAGEVDEVVEAISTAFSKAWDSQAKETRRGKHSNGWWTQECSDSIAVYRASHDADDWADYRRVMRAAKREFFEDRINHVASINQRAWDLMAWTRKRNLPTYEAISY
jgi:hypothetical protein